jgi:Mg2+-importing ATPase
VLRALGSSDEGLAAAEAARRLAALGPNVVVVEHAMPAWRILRRQFASPLVLLLVAASLIALALGEKSDTVMLLVMVAAAGLLGFVQEYRSERSLRQLRRRLAHTAVVVRGGAPVRLGARELVPGDVVLLGLGAIVPADLRLVTTDDLALDESTLTGESMPVAKDAAVLVPADAMAQERANTALQGTHVVQGSARGVVVATGSGTEMGRTAAALALGAGATEFERGVAAFGAFLVRVTLGLSVVVFLILGLLRGQWTESLLFAVALAVGIAPELLPVVVTINLSRGAIAMSRRQVLIKRLSAIEDLGNAGVLCTDKTGTLTEGQLEVLGAYAPGPGAVPDTEPLDWAALCLDLGPDGGGASPIDRAILRAGATTGGAPWPQVTRHETIAFDFARRRMSTVVGLGDDRRWLVTKGAVAEVLAVCRSRDTATGGAGAADVPLDEAERRRLLVWSDEMHDRGVRLLAVANRRVPEAPSYGPAEERDMTLLGFVALSDTPKASAAGALAALQALGVRVVILTGDHERISRRVAEEIGFPVAGVMTGADVEAMDDAQLQEAVGRVDVFARITPAHKLRILHTLRQAGHSVAFMGDGVNDAPALRMADVGISFEDAVDVAKEAAAVILLQKDLRVLADGIREGRRTFANTRTYLRATISSNFGNMLSVAGAALLLPFIPLRPEQILLLNLLSDLPMLSISTDRVPEAELARPRRWDVHETASFMYFFGTISSVADYATFALMLHVTQANVTRFRSGWFLESMLTELIVIFLVRTRGLGVGRSGPGRPLVAAAVVTVLLTIALLWSSLAAPFGLGPVPARTVGFILLIVAAYAVLTELGKRAFFRLRAQAP